MMKLWLVIELRQDMKYEIVRIYHKEQDAIDAIMDLDIRHPYNMYIKYHAEFI